MSEGIDTSNIVAVGRNPSVSKGVNKHTRNGQEFTSNSKPSLNTFHEAQISVPDYLKATFCYVPSSFREVQYNDLRFKGAHYFADFGLKSYLLILGQIASQEPDEKQLFICPDDLSAYHFQAELTTLSSSHAQNSELISASHTSDPSKPIKFLDYKSLGLENDSDINKVVDNFINEHKLSGTSKLYFYQGEHLSTELGSKFFKSLVTKLKTQEPNLQVFAISNYNITHEISNHDQLSSSALYGAESNLPGIQLVRTQKKIPAVTVEGLQSIGSLDGHREVVAAGKGDDHNNFLLDKVQEELQSRSQKILIKTSSRAQINKLAELAKSRNLNIGFYNSRNSPPSKSIIGGKEKMYINPYELIKAWGKDFDVLVHCQKFDGMEISADCLFVDDITDSDYELAKIIAPVFTLDESTIPKKIYYLHGEHNDFPARLERIQNHNRHKISGGVSSTRSCEGSPLPATGDIVEHGESRPLPALGLFWDIFNKPNIDFKALASSYLKAKNLKLEVFDLDSLAENIKLGYNKNLFTEEINLEDIYRYAFTYFSKPNNLSNAISTYPSLLGIKNLHEASDRVFSIYESNYHKLQSSSLLNEFNTTNNKSGDTVWRFNSSIIAEFLFAQAPQYLTQQDFYAPDKKYDQVLADVIFVLMGVKKDFDQDSPLATLKLNFQKFLNQKRSAREAETKKNNWNMTKKECQGFVEEFLLEDCSKQGLNDFDNSKIPILTDAFYGLQKIPNDEDLNARFYRYVINKKQELKHPILLASILPPETEDDKKFLINAIKPDFPQNLDKLFTIKKKDLTIKFQEYLLSKYPDKLSSRESIETFMSEFKDLNSPKTREFLKFVFGTITPEIYEALKFNLEFENIDEKIEFLKYKLKKSIKIQGNAIDTQTLDLTKILKEAKIDLDEVFNYLQISENLSILLSDESDFRSIIIKRLSEETELDLNCANVYFLPEPFDLLLDQNSQPFNNYLKQELVLAELLKQISPKDTKFSRIIECDNDDDPEDTRVLIVKFEDSFKPNVYFFDSLVKKPANPEELKTINLVNLEKNNNRNKLFNYFNYYLQVYPYLQFNSEQQSCIKTKLNSLFVTTQPKS